ISPTLLSGITTSLKNFTVNISATDITLQNITIRLYNSSNSLIRTNSSNNSFSIFYSGLSDGLYFYNATATDSLNAKNNTETRNITIDSTAPGLSFISPLAANYSNRSTLINLSVSGAQNIW